MGTHVRSHYRAPWTGVVVATGKDQDWTARTSVWVNRDNETVDRDAPTPSYCLSNVRCVLVKVTHDRNGRALRKPKWHVLDSAWLDVIAA